MPQTMEIARMGKNHIAIILALYLKGEMIFTEIRRLVKGGYDYAEGLLYDLKRWGLVTETRAGRKRIFKLTARGRALAEAFREAVPGSV